MANWLNVCRTHLVPPARVALDRYLGKTLCDLVVCHRRRHQAAHYGRDRRQSRLTPFSWVDYSMMNGPFTYKELIELMSRMMDVIIAESVLVNRSNFQEKSSELCQLAT